MKKGKRAYKVDKHLEIMYAITTFKRTSMVDFRIICTLCAGEVGKPRLPLVMWQIGNDIGSHQLINRPEEPMRNSNAVSIIFMVVIITSIALAGTWEENFNNGLPDGWEEINGKC